MIHVIRHTRDTPVVVLAKEEKKAAAPICRTALEQ
jgi:hypothetical protein